MPSKLADPKWRVERAVKANQASNSAEAAVRRVVRRLPELSPEQRAELARLLVAPDGGDA